jgi:hypothetical protein
MSKSSRTTEKEEVVVVVVEESSAEQRCALMPAVCRAITTCTLKVAALKFG